MSGGQKRTQFHNLPAKNRAGRHRKAPWGKVHARGAAGGGSGSRGRDGDVGRADWVAIIRCEWVLVHVEVDLKVAAGFVVVNGVLVRPDLPHERHTDEPEEWRMR